MATNEDSQINGKKWKCPKCRSFNTLSIGEGKDQSCYCLDCDYIGGTGLNNQNNKVSKSNISRIISGEIRNIIDEIELLISNRKKIEKDFEQSRKKLLIEKKINVINSSNWEDWKMLSLEYDEIKQIINEIDEKWLALKQIQTSLKKKCNYVD